jgi:quercetin 2,3-dioxygenase
VTIHRDVDLYVTLLNTGQTVTHELSSGRSAWVQVARGSITLNGERLKAGDGVAIEKLGVLRLDGTDNAEALVFDMVM